MRRFGRVYELGMMGIYKLRTRDFFSDLAKFPTMLRKGKMKLMPPSARAAEPSLAYSTERASGGRADEIRFLPGLLDGIDRRGLQDVHAGGREGARHRARGDSGLDLLRLDSRALRPMRLLAASLPARNLAIAESMEHGRCHVLRGVLQPSCGGESGDCRRRQAPSGRGGVDRHRLFGRREGAAFPAGSERGYRRSGDA